MDGLLTCIGFGESQTNGVAPPVIHPSRRVLIGVLCVTLIVALGLSVVESHISSPRVFRGKLVELLPQPEEVPGWQIRFRPVADSHEMKKAVADALNYDDGILVDFTAGDLRASIYAAYWTPGKMPHRLVAGHTPDICWVGAGWERQSSRVTSAAIGAERLGGIPMEHRVYRLRDQVEYVVFCHITGGRPMSYGTTGLPPWYAVFGDIFTKGLRQREEQFFVRISSNRPVEDFREAAPVNIFLRRLAAVLPGKTGP